MKRLRVAACRGGSPDAQCRPSSVKLCFDAPNPCFRPALRGPDESYGGERFGTALAAGPLPVRPLAAASVLAGAITARPRAGRPLAWPWPVMGRAMGPGPDRAVDGRPGPVTNHGTAPAMPTNGAAPAKPGPPCEAAPVPARALPPEIVPAISLATPEELHRFDRRALAKRIAHGEAADAKLSRGGKGELRD